jgi:hypothetical protein
MQCLFGVIINCITNLNVHTKINFTDCYALKMDDGSGYIAFVLSDILSFCHSPKTLTLAMNFQPSSYTCVDFIAEKVR